MQNAQQKIFNDIQALINLNPHLSIEEIQALIKHRMSTINQQPIGDFFGLSSDQMHNWMNAPLDQLDGVSIVTAEDFSKSPVMRYLGLILDFAMDQGGSFKATPKGNLPTLLVHQASALFSEFDVSQYVTNIDFNDFMGRNEDNFNALHYTRILATLAGFIYLKKGRFHVKKSIAKQYHQKGLPSLFLPLFNVAVRTFNWGYFDGVDDTSNPRPVWLFMVWRFQHHGRLERLVQDVANAFPILVPNELKPYYNTPLDQLTLMIELRFLKNFLQFWGFISFDSYRFYQKHDVLKVDILPLYKKVFQFSEQPADI